MPIEINGAPIIENKATDQPNLGECSLYGLNNLSGTGLRNIGIGSSAGKCITTGCNNILVGSNSGLNLTTGGDNVFVGRSAGQTTTGCGCNIAIGANAFIIGCGNCNVIVGTSANCSGNQNNAVAIGTESCGRTDGVAIGYQATNGASDGVSIGSGTSGDGVGIGKLAGNSTAGTSCSVYVGTCAMGSATENVGRNVAIGHMAMSCAGFQSSGHKVAIGYLALCNGLTGCGSIAVGYGAMKNEARTLTSSLSSNIAIGVCALSSLTTGNSNVAIGALAGESITTGNYNISMGIQSNCSITSGSLNISIGLAAGCNISSGVGNISIGVRAGIGAPISSHNVLIGSYAGEDSGDSYNVFLGEFAGACNTGGCNVAIGSNALSGRNGSSSSLYTGIIAIGHHALCSCAGGYGGIAIGYCAMPNDIRSGTRSTIQSNIAIGSCTMTSLVGGHSNISIGAVSGLSITTGCQNVSIGNSAGTSITTGCRNVSIGSEAGLFITTGCYNTSIGTSAGGNISTGCQNVTLGHNAYPSSGTVSGEFTLGNSFITNLRCNDTSITSLSDERDKKDIADLDWSTDFIKDLRPVKFEWNRRDGSMEGKKDLGFIAQELDTVEQKYSSQEYTRLVHKENPDKLEADPMKTYPILVKALQDIINRIEAIEAQLNM